MARKSFLSALVTIAACYSAVLLLLVLFTPAAGAQRSPQAAGQACPSTMPSDRVELTCRCGVTEGSARVWGTDTYTDDSALCHAAIHAGAISRSGGVVRVHARSGRASYAGTTRNGVATSDYGEWGRSIVFDDARTVANWLGGAPECPAAYNAGPRGWSGDCRCAEIGSGQVWGSNPYTSDSGLCRAAVHAGVIGAGGGVVRVTSAPGQNSYAGSTRNGVTTLGYGSWDASFRISAAN